METYCDVPVKYRAKEYHATMNSRKKARKAFADFFGDVPIASFNEITKKWETCVNTRGNAYAARKRLKYRKKRDD
jgi:hypothetical protein